MTTELAVRGSNGATVVFERGADIARLADTLANAPEGMIPKAYAGKAPAIFACIAYGAEMGIGPMQSLRSIYVVDGKPTLSAELMLAVALGRGERIEWLALTEEEAHCRLTRPGYPAHEHRWTIEDGRRAGLAGKDNWKKYPRAMLRSRCLTEALRSWAPDVLGCAVYDEDEGEEIAKSNARKAPAITVAAVETPAPAAPAVVESTDITDAARDFVRAYDSAATDAEIESVKESLKTPWKTMAKADKEAITKAAARARVRVADAPKAKPAEAAPDEVRAIEEAERLEAGGAS